MNETGEQSATDTVRLIATAAFGLEAIVARELTALGYASETFQPGRLLIQADALAICRMNINLRSAERVLICVGQFPADDFGKLYDGTNSLPWERWIPADGSFPVRGRSIKSQLSSVPACQRMVKKAVADRLLAAHRVATLEETAAEYRVEVALLNDLATVTIDTSGDGLHKRGYRPISGRAPLRETLAAALVQLSYWKPDRPLIDPFCGTGTIPIEAALIGRQLAPGLRRKFAAETWPQVPAELWQQARDQAGAAILPALPERIRALDIHEGALRLARQNAQAAGVEDDIHFQNKPFAELSSKRQYGCLIANPPYGQRMGEDREIAALYHLLPTVLRRLPTWSHYVLTAFPNFEAVIGQSADRRRKLYNGRIECQYYQFHGPRPPRADRSTTESTPSTPAAAEDGSLPVAATPTPPAFGGLLPAADRQSQEFGNRLRKRARHLRRWPGRGITCYRLYERDIPEVPLVVDRYEDHLHMAEFARPHDRTPAEHADWLDLMQRTAADAMEIPVTKVSMKFRDRQRGSSQYERRGHDRDTLVVNEGGLKFQVNLSDYVDTGLFLDHRLTRGMVRDEAAGKRVLNLFGYTGAFTVYAAAGSASQTTTVDLSRTYLDWAGENLDLNGLLDERHRFIQSDAVTYVRDLQPDVKFDLAVVDPPTFSNSKDLAQDWDVQRDHAHLLRLVSAHMTRGGVIYFSTNFRRFKLSADALSFAEVVEISQQTVPPDFRNRRIHRCWRLGIC